MGKAERRNAKRGVGKSGEREERTRAQNKVSMYYQRCDVRIQEPTARPVAPLVTGVPPNLLKESVGTLTDATLEWVTLREGAGRAERARRPTAGPCFMFADAESESILSLVGYLAGGSRARGARPATDSGAGRYAC